MDSDVLKKTVFAELLGDIRSGMEGVQAGLFPSRIEKLAERILAAVESESDLLKQLVEAVVPPDTTGESSFYDTLSCLHRVLGYGRDASRVGGLVWREALVKMEREKQVQLLVSFPLFRGRHLFELLQSLPVVLEKFPVPAEDAIPWFRRLSEAIGNDMANAGYWLGIDAWTKFDPQNAANALRQLVKDKGNEQSLSVGSRILANLRHLGNECPTEVNLPEMEDSWPNSTSLHVRLLQFRSWIDTILISGIMHEQVQHLLDRFKELEPAEETEAFSVIRCLIVSGKIPAESIGATLHWLAEHASPESDPLCKYSLCVTARVIWSQESLEWTSAHKQILRDLVIKIQPILPEHQGIWMEVDQLLVAVLKSGEHDAADFLGILFDRNPKGFRELVNPSNRSRLFYTELATWTDLPKLLFELFSPEMPRRRLALNLINSGLPLNLPKEQIKALPEHRMALAILQIRLDYISPQQACPLLLQLLPRIEKSSANLKNLFSEELSYQSRNLPGLCLEAFKKIQKPSPLLRSAIETAQNYFERLRNSARSPVTALHVPGLKLARQTIQRRQSRVMNKTAREGSPLLQFMKSVSIVYGSEGFASYHEGVVSEPSPFQSFSTSAEFPRLDTMDYDGQKVRQHDTLMMIHSVEAQLSQTSQANES
jgi:hypothetical protein